jgi:hypothetical protein
MKKIIVTALAVFAFSFANAQDGNFKAGIHLGMPMGDAKNIYSLNWGLDAAYLWKVADNFQAGLTTGYSSFSGKDITTSTPAVYASGILVYPETSSTVKVNAAYIPLAASGLYSFSDNIFGGLDFGYAIYSGNGGGNGGVYYQPKVGYQTEKYEVYAGYKGISANGGTISSIGLGFNYKF